jgi:hypothetical protein
MAALFWLLLPAMTLSVACRPATSTTRDGGGPPHLDRLPGCASAVFRDQDSFCVVRKSDGRLSCGSLSSSPVTLKTVPGIFSPTMVGFERNDRCAALADGTVSCWSEGPGAFSATPAAYPSFSHAVTAIPVGGEELIKLGAVTSDGALFWEDNAGKVWTDDSSLAQFSGSPLLNCRLYRDGSLNCVNPDPEEILFAGSGAVSFAGSENRLCYLDQKGNVSSVWSTHPILDNVAQLSGFCARKNDGSLWCWSYSYDNNPKLQWGTPVELAGPNSVVYLGNGCALLDGGAVYCWDGTTPPKLVTTACD